MSTFLWILSTKKVWLKLVHFDGVIQKMFIFSDLGLLSVHWNSTSLSVIVFVVSHFLRLVLMGCFRVFTCFVRFYVIVSSWYVVKFVGLSRGSCHCCLSFTVMIAVILSTVLMNVYLLSKINWLIETKVAAFRDTVHMILNSQGVSGARSR